MMDPVLSLCFSMLSFTFNARYSHYALSLLHVLICTLKLCTKRQSLRTVEECAYVAQPDALRIAT